MENMEIIYFIRHQKWRNHNFVWIPSSIKKIIKGIQRIFGEGKEIHVSRELTKKFEEHIGHKIDEVIEFFEDKEVIGEITIVLKGIKGRSINHDKSTIKKDLNELIKAGLSLSAASKYLAKKNGLKKSEIYNMI